MAFPVEVEVAPLHDIVTFPSASFPYSDDDVAQFEAFLAHGRMGRGLSDDRFVPIALAPGEGFVEFVPLHRRGRHRQRLDQGFVLTNYGRIVAAVRLSPMLQPDSAEKFEEPRSQWGFPARSISLCVGSACEAGPAAEPAGRPRLLTRTQGTAIAECFNGVGIDAVHSPEEFPQPADEFLSLWEVAAAVRIIELAVPPVAPADPRTRPADLVCVHVERLALRLSYLFHPFTVDEAARWDCVSRNLMRQCAAVMNSGGIEDQDMADYTDTVLTTCTEILLHTQQANMDRHTYPMKKALKHIAGRLRADELLRLGAAQRGIKGRMARLARLAGKNPGEEGPAEVFAPVDRCIAELRSCIADVRGAFECLPNETETGPEYRAPDTAPAAAVRHGARVYGTVDRCIADLHNRVADVLEHFAGARDAQEADDPAPGPISRRIASMAMAQIVQSLREISASLKDGQEAAWRVQQPAQLEGLRLRGTAAPKPPPEPALEPAPVPDPEVDDGEGWHEIMPALVE